MFERRTVPIWIGVILMSAFFLSGQGWEASQDPPLPIGGVLAWAKNIAGVPSLPLGFVECNGQTLGDPESPLDGQVIPDLNGENRFLMGSSTSGGTGGYAQHTLTHWDSIQSGAHEPGTKDIIAHVFDNRPPYYEVVWVMRVK